RYATRASEQAAPSTTYRTRLSCLSAPGSSPARAPAAAVTSGPAMRESLEGRSATGRKTGAPAVVPSRYNDGPPRARRPPGVAVASRHRVRDNEAGHPEPE